MKKRYLVIGFVAISVVLGVTACGGKARHAHFGDKMFSKFDTDKDGFVDKTEYFAISTGRFERADDNKDGKVSKKESTETFIAKRFPSKIEQWLKESDLDKDGFISNMEMREKSKAEFLKQDTNSDSKLSKEEMSSYRKSLRKSHE